MSLRAVIRGINKCKYISQKIDLKSSAINCLRAGDNPQITADVVLLLTITDNACNEAVIYMSSGELLKYSPPPRLEVFSQTGINS